MCAYVRARVRRNVFRRLVEESIVCVKTRRKIRREKRRKEIALGVHIKKKKVSSRLLLLLLLLLLLSAEEKFFQNRIVIENFRRSANARE